MISKVREIVEAYATMINPTESQKQAAEIRLQICMGCEFWRESPLGIRYCGKCGCPTKGKIFSSHGVQACPEKKWTI